MLFRVIPRVLFFLVLAVAIIGVFVSATNDGSAGTDIPQQAPRYARQMIVMIIDGLQADSLQQLQAPNINGVGSSGVRVSQAITPFPATLETSVGSLLTGCDPRAHRFYESGNKPAEPTLLRMLEQKRIETAMFDATGRLGSIGSECKTYKKYASDQEMVTGALEFIRDKRPYLSVLVFGETGKSLAQQNGQNSNAYAKAVSDTDNRVGEILRFLHSNGTYEQTLLAICGTSGKPAMIIKSPQFKCGVNLPPANLTDLAPTLGYVVGVQIPEASGLVLWNAFEPGSFQNGIYLMEQRIKDLSNAQVRAREEIAALRGNESEVAEERRAIDRERANTRALIEERDGQIGTLNWKVKLLLGVIGLLVVLALYGYLVQYRYLRRKFLLFK